MKALFSILFLSIFLTAHVLAGGEGLPVIPKPQSEKKLEGRFKVSRKTSIYVDTTESRSAAEFLQGLIRQQYGLKLKIVNNPRANNVIIFRQGDLNNNTLAKTGSYRLRIDKTRIVIDGSETGQFYALQTLRQLLPVTKLEEISLPAVEIADEPTFQYRGLHLDVARHFMPLDFVKKYIDLMSQYKLNYFHWHLTDDQGWRIEIKKYPRLTQVGGTRRESHSGRYSPVFKGDGIPVEGFYTQDQIREVVEFARKRMVTIVPEIEMPGHSSAALTAYPEFGCKENYEYKVQQTWGIFKEVFCPTDKTFEFLEDVLEETIALFPNSPYIHVGGDEVLKDHWKESEFVQGLKRRENLKDEHEVQSYFIRRIEKFINSKGKIMVGWDEILEGGLAPNAVVMSWRGERGGIEAAKSGHNVIMTPGNSLYFDYGQGDPRYEPLNIGNHLPLETVYKYDPVPKELTQAEAKYILGAQANVWTEYMKTSGQVEYMVFPRMLALSEVVWTPPGRKDLADFNNRLFLHYPRLDAQNVKYRIPAPVGLRNQILTDSEGATISLSIPIPGSKLFYTLDGSEPGENSKLYAAPFDIKLKPGERIDLKVAVVTPDKRKSITHSGVIWRRSVLAGADLGTKRPGVRAKFLFGATSLPDLLERAPNEGAESRSIQLPQFQARTKNYSDPFGVIFEGLIFVPAEEIYAFEVESDGQTFLEIGGENIVGGKAENIASRTGIVPLGKGYHLVRFGSVHRGPQPILNLRWGVNGTGLRRIYGSELFVKQ